MRSFGAARMSAGAKYIKDHQRYYHQFLPSLEKKFRSQGRGSFADVVKLYRTRLAMTGSESQSRDAVKGKAFVPPSSNEFVLTFQNYMALLQNSSSAALSASVDHFYKQVVGAEAKTYTTGGAVTVVMPEEESASKGGIKGGVSVPQTLMPAGMGGRGAGGAMVSDTSDMYDMEEVSMFEQYKWPIIGGTVLLLGGGAYYFFFMRK